MSDEGAEKEGPLLLLAGMLTSRMNVVCMGEDSRGFERMFAYYEGWMSMNERARVNVRMGAIAQWHAR